MPDPRFFEQLGPFTLAQVAAVSGAALSREADGSSRIASVAPLHLADTDAISFLSDRKHLSALRQTVAGACFLPEIHAGEAPAGCVVLLTSEPQAAFARCAARLHPPWGFGNSDADIHPDAVMEPGVRLGRGAIVGPGARIGAGTEIGPGAVIGPGVAIGRECRIGANAVVGFALVGDRVRILAGAVIGEAGFGVAESRAGAVDVPQLGRVILQDGVTIGANTCVDRGAYEDTVVGENTKIDNLVQVAHNVQIGRDCVLAAHTGLSGSVKVGDGAMFGGRAGIADHLTIGARARVAAAAGVMHDIPDGEVWCGAPARPIRRFMRETAWLAKNAAAKTGGGER